MKILSALFLVLIAGLSPEVFAADSSRVVVDTLSGSVEGARSGGIRIYPGRISGYGLKDV